MIKTFDHVALSVKDISASVEWYEDNFSAQVKYKDDTWAMLLIGHTCIALTLPDQHPSHVAFSVETFSDLGENPQVHRDGSSYIYKSDPDGNTIELIYWGEKQ